MDERRVERSLDNDLPPEVIGNILSQMGSARQVAMASTTSRRWRDAAAQYLWRLTFDISDLPNRSISKEDSEMIMTEAIMKTTSLCELSIGAMDNVQIHGASVMAWLFHTKKTLKSLTLMARVTVQVDILRTLSGNEEVLEHLVWRPTYVPVLNPVVHNLPFLVSLTLDSALQCMSCNNLQALLSIFPKLEFLCLSIMSIKNAPSTFDLYISPSLKTLKMEMIRFESSNWLQTFTSTNIVLHAHNLERLSLSNVESEGFVDFDIRQIRGLKELVIQNVNITWLELVGDNLQHLVIADAQFPVAEIGSLPSLHYLKLSKTGHLMPYWPTYSQIIVHASSKLRSLQLLGGLPAFAALDVEMILSSFPYLRWLALDYQHAIFGDHPQRLQVSEQLVDLEVHTVVEATNPKLFARWAVKFLKCCPNLQRLAIALQAGDHDNKLEFCHRLASLVGYVMYRYPHVDLQID